MSLASALIGSAEQQGVASSETGLITLIGENSDLRISAGSLDIDFSGMAFLPGDVADLIVVGDAVDTNHDFSFTEPGWDRNIDENFNYARQIRVCQFTKILSANEPLQQIISTQTGPQNEQWSFVLQVKRGVDTANPIDVTHDTALHLDFGTGNSTPTNNPINTVTQNAQANIVHGWRGGAQITSVGVPVGWTQAQAQLATSHVRFAKATITAATPGTVTPGEWTHAHTAEQDYWTLTYALRPA